MTDPDHTRDDHLPAVRDNWLDSPQPMSSVHPDPYQAHELAPVTRREVTDLITHIAVANQRVDQRQPRPARPTANEDLWPLLIVFTMFAIITILALVTIAVVILGT